MSRRPLLQSSSGLALLLCALATIPVGEAHAAPALQQVPEDAAEASDDDLADGLKRALDEIDALRKSGDLDAARGQLAELADGEAFSKLLAQESDAALDVLAAVDRLAGRLSLLEIVERVRAERLERLSSAHDPDDPAVLSAETDLAVTRRRLGDVRGAHRLFEHVHAVRSRTLPEEDAARLRAELNLAVTRQELGDLEGALELEEHVHAIRSRLLTADDPDLIVTKLNLALLRGAQGDLQGERDLEETVLEARSRLLPPDHPDLLLVQQNLAATRMRLGDLEGANELFEHVHETLGRLLPEDHPDRLTAEHNLSITRRALGDLKGALELAEHVHAVRSRQLPPDHPDLLGSKLNLAVTRKASGDLKGALEMEEFILATLRRLLPADHPDLLASKDALGVTRAKLGDLEGALELFEEVHEAYQRLLPEDHSYLLDVRQNLALVRRELGDLEGARELEEQTVASWTRLLAPDHPDLLRARLNLASTLMQMGEPKRALELLEQVHAAWTKLLPEDHPDLLLAEQNLASAKQALGDLQGSLELSEQVYTARSRVLPPDHPELLAAELNLAVSRKILGDLEGARELEEHVHEAWSRLLPADHPDLLSATDNLAGTRRRLGEREGALELTRSMLDGMLSRAERLRTRSPRFARAAALAELERLGSALSSTVPRSPEEAGGDRALEERLFTVLESLRMVSTSSTEVALAVAGVPELEALRDRLSDARARLNDLSLTPPTAVAELGSWRQELVKLADVRDGLERELRAALRERGVLADLPSGKSVAASLPREATLISYLRYARSFDRDVDTGRGPPPVDSLLAFVVEPSGRTHRVELGPAGPIEDLAARWRAALGSPLVSRGQPIDGAEERDDESEIGSELRARILDPCLAGIDSTARSKLLLILDDFLHLIPFGALPSGEGGRLGGATAVRTESSTLRLVAPARPLSGGGILLTIGGVDYDAESASSPDMVIPTAPPPLRVAELRGEEQGPLRELPETLREVELLGKLHEEWGGGERVRLTGRAATKQALVDRAADVRFLHVATHGWFAPEKVVSMLDDSREGWSLGAVAEVSRAAATVRGFVPETLCGLALAGANRGVNEQGRVPGILTAEELATLDLSNCELAVLSACETNVGIRRAGQGIQSLQSALHAAGARTAITSLWKVDDAATRRLMELFYTKLWKDGLGKADALWQAKMALREDGHPIRDWAGWVLTGDPD